MTPETLKTQWQLLKGELKTHWGKLTDDDLKVIDGNIDQFVAKVHEVYGEGKEAVREKVKDLVEKLQKALSKDHPKDGPKA
ncbi:MAG: CsbD family protein [Myxococcota bacterium]